jgi:hypothetical protein
LHLPLRQWFVQALNLAHAERKKQIADRTVGGKPVQTQPRKQRTIAPHNARSVGLPLAPIPATL